MIGYQNTETGKLKKFHWIDLDMIAEALYHEIHRPDTVFKRTDLLRLFHDIKREMEPAK